MLKKTRVKKRSYCSKSRFEMKIRNGGSKKADLRWSECRSFRAIHGIYVGCEVEGGATGNWWFLA